MTIKELKELLSKFDDNVDVGLCIETYYHGTKIVEFAWDDLMILKDNNDILFTNTKNIY